jgi:hypothetical protein
VHLRTQESRVRRMAKRQGLVLTAKSRVRDPEALGKGQWVLSIDQYAPGYDPNENEQTEWIFATLDEVETFLNKE